MEETSIYISSADRVKVGTSKTHDFQIKLKTTYIQIRTPAAIVQ